MNTDQNSADPGAGNAMAWRETLGTVQPDANFTLYELEFTDGNFPGHIQIAIPKPPSTDSIHPSSSHCENTNSKRLHPSASTNARNLKRKHTGDGADRASKRAPSPTFRGGRLADLRGPPIRNPTIVTKHADMKRKRTGDDAARASKRAPSPTFRGGRLADLRGPPIKNPAVVTKHADMKPAAAIQPEVPPVDTFEFLEWVRSQIVGYAPADAKRMLSAIGCLRGPDTRELGFEIALKILGRHIATLVEEAKEMKIRYDKVQKSGGPCVESLLQTLEQAIRQTDKRRDDSAERVRAFEAEAKA